MASTRLSVKQRLCGFILATLGLGSPLTTPAATPTFGVFLPVPGTQVSYSNGVANYENWLNIPASPIMAFGPNDSWTSLTGSSPGVGLAWAVKQFAPPYSSRVVWSIPMFPFSNANGVYNAYGNSLSAGAAGQYTGASNGAGGFYPNYWAQVAQTLIGAGYGSSTVRIGWEFNGSWFPWCEGGAPSYGLTATPAQYAQYWKNIVLAMRAVPGAHFKFNWCAGAGDNYSGSTRNDPDAAFPAPDTNGSYVDEVGVDVYDTDPSGNYYPYAPNTWASTGYNTPALQTQKHNQNWVAMTTYGTDNLNWWVKEAAGTNTNAVQKNVLPLTFPEWGLNGGNKQWSEGGGDNPIFVQNMYNFFTKTTNNVTWASYFQSDVSFPSSLFIYNTTTGAITSDFPVSSGTFTSAFGSTTPTVVYPVFTETPTGWVNHVAWTGGYGTKTATVVGKTGSLCPYSGIDQYQISYTSAAGFQLAFSAQNLTSANYVRLAIRGPVTNATQTVVLRLTDQTGGYGSPVTLTTTNNNNYYLLDVPMSSLTGANITQINSLYFYMVTGSGVSDTFYIDNVEFINK